MTSAQAFAAEVADPFLDVVAQYKAAKPKPELSEEARKYKVQAEFMVQEKQADKAIALYGKALAIAPWWPEGHYKLALLLGEKKKYRDAMSEMQRYLLLAPEGADARAAQDKIYQWEVVAEPVAIKVFNDCPECPEMVELPAGSFDMGSTKGKADEQPVHRVTVKSFAIGKTEVTQAQWQAVMGSNPSNFTGCGDTCPVEQVSWDDAQAYIKKLNAKTGKQYRLPTEAEWEYACRAGTEFEYCGSDTVDSVSWNDINSGSFFFNTPHPVATKQANAFGLYDMSGNVWEWVEDTYHPSYEGAPADGSARTDGSMRVLRGGSWGYEPKFGRASARIRFSTSFRYYSHGFRLARSVQ
ncbi:MAG: SUMF1/EgtB/PvdO family nonheme iron enzyme [Nitrosomonadales bacterium]|nr:SUMF1/EgtB/PvdO family nonheme iron enzyme [Nitrosomonadales bacterium]